MAYTPPSTVTSSDVLTAALWNTQIRDNFDSLPRGIVAKAQAVTTQSGITTATDLTGLAVTWTATSPRIYLVSVIVNVAIAAGAGFTTLYITDAANVTKQATLNEHENVSGIPHQFGMFVQRYETGLSGSQTRKARLGFSSGSGALVADVTYPAQIIVQDLGLA